MIIQEHSEDIATPTGPMRTSILRPVAPGQYAGLLCFSEIYQVTGPVRRAAAMLAGHGFVVMVPEVYHELEPLGTVLDYDTEGTDRGNAHKFAKPVAAYDSDARAALDHLRAQPYCTGKLGTMGICLGAISPSGPPCSPMCSPAPASTLPISIPTRSGKASVTTAWSAPARS